MSTTAGDQMRPVYETGRVKFIQMPIDIQIDDDYTYQESGANALQRGVNSKGWPIFAVRFDFVPHQFRLWGEIYSALAHEFGHAVAAWLYWMDPNGDWYQLWHEFMGWPGTYHDNDANYSDSELGSRGKTNEKWANAFRAILTGVPNAELAPNLSLSTLFFQSLLHKARPTLLESPSTPTSSLPTTTGGLMNVVDLRGQLPLANQFIPSPSHASKDSNTVHWTGGSDTVTTDVEAIAAIKRWHQEHINKDWNTEATGQQGGAGIMYLEVIAPSGTVFLTRDSDAVTWHCSDPYGNAHSRPILVICDQDDLPTAAQLVSLEQRLTFPNVYPHKFWVGTQCPGPELLAYLSTRGDDIMREEDFVRIQGMIDDAERRTATKLDAGFNVTMLAMLRRTLRSIIFIVKGTGKMKDPGGDYSQGLPPRAFSDDNLPIV